MTATPALGLSCHIARLTEHLEKQAARGGLLMGFYLRKSFGFGPSDRSTVWPLDGVLAKDTRIAALHERDLVRLRADRRRDGGIHVGYAMAVSAPTSTPPMAG